MFCKSCLQNSFHLWRCLCWPDWTLPTHQSKRIFVISEGRPVWLSRSPWQGLRMHPYFLQYYPGPQSKCKNNWRKFFIFVPLGMKPASVRPHHFCIVTDTRSWKSRKGDVSTTSSMVTLAMMPNMCLFSPPVVLFPCCFLLVTMSNKSVVS